MNILLAIGATIGGLSWIPVLIRVLMSRPKTNAEADKTKAEAAAINAETATELIAPLRAELAACRKRQTETETALYDALAELRALRAHVSEQTALLRRNGIPAPQFVWPQPEGS